MKTLIKRNENQQNKTIYKKLNKGEICNNNQAPFYPVSQNRH